MFLKYHHCEDCETEWVDEWSSLCDDDCPTCGKDIEPYDWEEWGDDEDDDVITLLQNELEEDEG